MWTCRLWRILQLYKGVCILTNSNGVDIIDIESYPNLVDIVEKCYIVGKNLYIELKKPKKDKIIATIKSEYTVFRKEIGKLLKEKSVAKDDSIKILDMIDNSTDVIYKDSSPKVVNPISIEEQDNNGNKERESDLSNLKKYRL
jgi:hypothetical protein